MDSNWKEAAHQAFRRSVDIAGDQSAFERQTGFKQQKVSYHLRDRKILPAEYVLAAEQATGVSRHDLRPDIYPRDLTAPAGTATLDAGLDAAR